MLGALNRVLRSYDNFGVPLNLNIRQQQEYKSVCGGVLSVFMTVVLIYILVSGLIGVFQRNTYIIEVQQLQDMDPDMKEMTSTNFMFAIKLDNPFLDHYGNKTAYNITMNQMKIETFSNGSKSKTHTKVYQLETCTTEHFPSINFDEFYQLESQLQNYLCLPANYSLFLQGTYNSKIMQYPRLSVALCTTDDCYSQIQANELAQNKATMVSISTIIQSAIFQGNATNNPLYYYLNSDFFLSTNLYTESQTDIFFQSNSIIDQKSLLSLYQDETKYDYWVFPIYSYREIKISHDNPSTLFSVNFRMSQEFQQISKKVNTIDQFLSYFGGMLKIISSIFGIVALQYNQMGLKLSLANALYEFNIPKKKDGKIEFSYDKLLNYIQHQINKVDDMIVKFKNHTMQVVKMSKVTRAITMRHQVSQQNLQNEKKNSVIEQTEPNQENAEKQSVSLQEIKESFLQNLFSEIVKSKHQLKLGLNFILYQLLCCSCIERIGMMRKILSQCEDVIQQDLDIVNILQKLQQIEKLKQTILEKEQIKVFNYTPKPIVNIKSNFKFSSPQDGESNQLITQVNLHRQHHQLLRQKTYTKPQHLLKIYKYYSKLKEADNPVNKRLISLMGPAMEQILERYYEVQLLSNHHFPNRNSLVEQHPEQTPQYTEKLISGIGSPSPGNENEHVMRYSTGKEHKQIMPIIINEDEIQIVHH